VCVCGSPHPVVQQPKSGLACLIIEISRSHTHPAGRTPVIEWSACHRGCCPHDKHERQTSMPSVGFKPAIHIITRLETYTSDFTPTNISWCFIYYWEMLFVVLCSLCYYTGLFYADNVVLHQAHLDCKEQILSKFWKWQIGWHYFLHCLKVWSVWLVK
jgi:hypothetical protein